MSRGEGRAEEWIEKGDKKLKGFGWFSGDQKYEEAAEMYTKGANMFKNAKQWDQAGAAFIRSAECHLKLQSKHEAATDYINASNCYRKTNVPEAVNSVTTAVNLYVEEGRFSIAAKHQKEIGEMYEQANEIEKSVDAYQKSADYYEGENSTSAANACLLKVAEMSAKLEKYERAIGIYETVAKKSLDNNLLKWSAKDYFFRGLLCHLCTTDLVSSKRALDLYRDMDVGFSSTRECKFLQDLLAAVEAYDKEALTQAVVDFDSISKLDQWKTTMLLRIKNGIAKVDDESLA